MTALADRHPTDPRPAEWDAAARAVAEAYRALGAAGLSFGSSGNVSQRERDGMVITRSGVTVDAVGAADTVALSLDGNVRKNSSAKPSSEWFMHAAIYRAYPAAAAVVHAHSDACTALACLGEAIPAFHYMVVGFGGAEIRCAPYVTFGTPELASHAVKALRGRTACLLANHGMICHAASLDKAMAAAVRLEALARQYLLARGAGTPRILDAEEVEAARRRYETYG